MWETDPNCQWQSSSPLKCVLPAIIPFQLLHILILKLMAFWHKLLKWPWCSIYESEMCHFKITWIGIKTHVWLSGRNLQKGSNTKTSQPPKDTLTTSYLHSVNY